MRVKVRKGWDPDELGELGTQMVAAEASMDHGVSGGRSTGRTPPPAQRVVVVGMKMDEPSREILTWALFKAARPGDRVFAIHVLPTPSSSSGKKNPASLPLLKLVKDFDSVLAVYEGFCKLKQIDLNLKLCRGASVRKALTREAAELQATQLILGVNADSHGFRSSSASVARYCARKLPAICSVIALDRGKVVFERTDPKRSCKTDHHRAADGSDSDEDTDAERDVRPLHSFLPAMFMIMMNHGCSSFDATRYRNSPLSDAATSTNRTSSWNSPTATMGSDADSQTGSPHSDETSPLAMVPVPDTKTTTRSLSVLIRDLPNPTPGWPLLRRAALQNNKAAAAAPSTSKMSVVQWVMQLPDRFPESPAHRPNHKPAGTDTTAATEFSGGISDENRTVAQPAGDVMTHSENLHDKTAGKDEPMFRNELESLRTKYGPVCRLFTYQQLAEATSNFSSDNLIGRGGSSHVYRGCLPGGRDVAIKIMKSTEDARREFALEIEMITALHHNNIITLLGFCVEDGNLLLVYHFLSRGSLEDNLHGEKHKKSRFTWPERYKVAIGVAQALQHLHSGESTRPVIHGDVKSSNILLSDSFEPALSDFGLATWVSSASSQITCTDVAGTFGYLAPEYFMFGKVNDKIDVYAFGVVLLELLSAKKPIGDEYPRGQESLVMWAKPILHSGQPLQLMDPSLGVQYDQGQAELMVLAASLCLRRMPQLRPKMDVVLKLLKGDCNLIKWARLQMKGMKDPTEGLDDESDVRYLDSHFRSHLNLALLDVEDDALSVSGTEHSIGDIIAHGSLEAYLQGRWSRSSSFD